MRELNIEVRAGIHTGETELLGDDIGGMAVHIGARVSSLSQPGELLVTRTVRDLVAGSGLEFSERGTHRLKGVPGEWEVLALAADVGANDLVHGRASVARQAEAAPRKLPTPHLHGGLTAPGRASLGLLLGCRPQPGSQSRVASEWDDFRASWGPTSGYRLTAGLRAS